MLDFGPAHPCKPSVFPADFSGVTNVCERVFTHVLLGIILVEGYCFLFLFFILIGGLEHTSVYTALPKLRILRINRVSMCDQSKHLAYVYEQAFCNVLVGFLQIFA